MPASKNSRKKKKSRSGKNRTSLQDHRKVGNQLRSGFTDTIGEKLTFTSWANERLPEMIWAAIIRVVNDQDGAISEFRRILGFVQHHAHEGDIYDITLSGIANLDVGLREKFISYILATPSTASALTALLLFNNLPARETWLKLLPDLEPNLDVLMIATGLCFPHQSQEATDCRWLKIMAHVVAGKLHINEEQVETWGEYPYKGDQRSVRPSIRSMEMIGNPLIEKDLTWPNAFWDEAWNNTPCLELMEERATQESSDITSDDISELVEKLYKHWSLTHDTTGVDAKHDAVFGICFYVLRVLDELLAMKTGILGRLGLRTILECHISLRYLLLKDDDDLWKKWRAYGAGQAKLNALRFDELMEPPKHIDLKTIEAIACEDLWEEFVNIELGSWSGLDLRKLSEKSGIKESYDAHYSWTSGYSHGTWGPIRESCFETCGNPLHRLHRYPKKQILSDVLAEACELVDYILDDLETVFPGFEQRTNSIASVTS